jgi:opacity protein-like surface antigen
MRKSEVLAAVIVLSLVGLSSGIFCQESEKEDSQACVPENKWGLQFSISKNFQLSNFQGTTLSLIRKLNEKRSLRAGISISGQSGENRSTITSLPQDSLMSKNKADNQNYNLDLSFDYLFTSELNDKISFYFGAGPILGLMNYDTKQYADSLKQINSTMIVTKTFLQSNKQTGWSIGLSGIAGIAWQVHKKILIHAEYKSTLYYQRNEMVSKNSSSKFKNVVESVTLRSNPVSFGVTVFI